MHYDIPEEALPWDLAFANNMIFKESSVSYQKKVLYSKKLVGDQYL